MSIERETAVRLVHQERTAAILAKTGGEIIHPDHYRIREAIRTAVLEAIDNETSNCDMQRMSDGELPNLFKALDGIAERVFLKSAGL